MTTSSVVFDRTPVEILSPHHLVVSPFNTGSRNRSFMAGPMHPTAEPVTFSNPPPRTPNTLLSPSPATASPSGPISALKSTESKSENGLSSIASAGLRTSPSPVMEKPVHQPPQPLGTAGNQDRHLKNDREGARSHHASAQDAREALGAAIGVSNDRTETLVNTSSTAAATILSEP